MVQAFTPRTSMASLFREAQRMAEGVCTDDDNALEMTLQLLIAAAGASTMAAPEWMQGFLRQFDRADIDRLSACMLDCLPVALAS